MAQTPKAPVKPRKRSKYKRPTEGELLVRRARVAQYHRLGWSPEQIAVELEMPLSSIAVDLQFLRKFPEFIESQSPYAVAIAAIADEVLAGDHRGIRLMLDVLRAEAENSKLVAEARALEVKPGGGTDGENKLTIEVVHPAKPPPEAA